MWFWEKPVSLVSLMIGVIDLVLMAFKGNTVASMLYYFVCSKEKKNYHRPNGLNNNLFPHNFIG